MRKFVAAVALAAVVIVIVAVGAKTQVATTVRECPKIVDVKLYVTSVWCVQILQTTILVLSN